MSAGHRAEEMTAYLGRVMEFLGSAAFAAERRMAREEYYGPGAAASEEPSAADEKAAYIDWLLFERPLTARRVTPVRMFVEQHPELPSRVRANLLACEHSVHSVFQVVSVRDDTAVVLDCQGDDDDYYRVSVGGRDLQEGMLISARLVRWDDEYLFHGPVTPWPAAPRDLYGPQHGRGGVVGDEESPSDWRARASSSRRAWLRERRRRP